jgi:hypothetical protein
MYECTYEDEIRLGFCKRCVWHQYRPAGWYVYGNWSRGSELNSFHVTEQVKLTAWCRKNLTHFWEITYSSLYISNIEDAVLFKLFWIN